MATTVLKPALNRMSKEDKVAFVNEAIAGHTVMVFSKSYWPYATQGKDAVESTGVQWAVVELDQCGEQRNGDVQNILKKLSGFGKYMTSPEHTRTDWLTHYLPSPPPHQRLYRKYLSAESVSAVVLKPDVPLRMANWFRWCKKQEPFSVRNKLRNVLWSKSGKRKWRSSLTKKWSVAKSRGTYPPVFPNN